MTNPFENEKGHFTILRNDEGQHSLWPAFKDVPNGWVTVFGPEGRQPCLDYVKKNWTDMRPARVVKTITAIDAK